jgi:hypothetical protein
VTRLRGLAPWIAFSRRLHKSLGSSRSLNEPPSVDEQEEKLISYSGMLSAFNLKDAIGHGVTRRVGHVTQFGPDGRSTVTTSMKASLSTSNTVTPQVLLMDPEKNQLSIKSPPISGSPLAKESAFFRRERLKKRFLKVLLYAAGAVVLLALHSLAQHDILTANFDLSSSQQMESNKHGRPRLTIKEREKLFLYVHRPLEIYVD